MSNVHTANNMSKTESFKSTLQGEDPKKVDHWTLWHEVPYSFHSESKSGHFASLCQGIAFVAHE